jgi:hypothetical protein
MDEELSTITEKYPNLTLVRGYSSCQLQGMFFGYKRFEDREISFSFPIRVEFILGTDDIPKLFVDNDQFPDDFKHFYSNTGSCCIGPNFEVRLKWMSNPTLLFFLEEFVAKFLYSAAWFSRYGTYPWGEYRHGNKGFIQAYRYYFNVQTIPHIIFCLEYLLVKQNIYGKDLCPCGSGKKFGLCHKILLDSIPYDSRLFGLFFSDLSKIKQLRGFPR